VVEVLKLPGRVKGGVAASSTLDVHSLAVYRMVLATSVLYDVLHDYMPYAEEFLSDDANVSTCISPSTCGQHRRLKRPPLARVCADGVRSRKCFSAVVSSHRA